MLLITCLAALTACDRPTLPTTPLNEEFVLAPGDTIAVDNASIQIRFDRVTGDSRCPGDAICITGGDAIVHVEVISALAATRRYELHTGNMQPVTHGDLTIHLVQLAPYPFSTRTIQPGDYRVTLRVTR